MPLFTVANVLPAQLQPIPRDPRLFELRSLYAALIEAVFVVRDQARRSDKNQTNQSHLAKQAALDREWLLSESDARPFSFVKVCQELGLGQYGPAKRVFCLPC
jgi:hypothetical protein